MPTGTSRAGTYRRIAFTAPGRLALETVPIPRPGETELLVAPEAVGICGTDLELLDGSMGYLRTGQAAYPIVPGHEWTGIVLEVGSAVTGCEPGDRVVGECTVACGTCEVCRGPAGYHLCPNRTETGIMRRPGALGELLVFPARAAYVVPSQVTVEDAALIEPLAIAYRGMLRLLQGRRPPVVIVGGGTIGLLCGLTARAMGVEDVTVLEPQPGRRAIAEELGFECPRGRVDRRWSAVVEASGTAPGVEAAVGAAAGAAHVLLLGLSGSESVPVDVDRVVLNDMIVKGSLGSPSVWPDVIELVAQGAVVPSRLVSGRYGLEQAAVALAEVRARAAGTLKVRVRPQG